MKKKNIVIAITFLITSVCLSGCNQQNQADIKFINKPLFAIAVDFEEIDNRYQKTEEIYKIEKNISMIMPRKNIYVLEVYNANFSGTTGLYFMSERILRYENREQANQVYNSIKQNYSYDFPQIEGEKFGEKTYIGKKTKEFLSSLIEIYMLIFTYSNIVVFLYGTTSFQLELHNFARLIEQNLKESTIMIEKETSMVLSDDDSMMKIKTNVSNGTIPLAVHFEVEIPDVFGFEKMVYWYLNDGNMSTDKKLNYTFTKTGEYEVVLIVPDDNGILHKNTIIITAEEPPAFKLISWEVIDNFGYAALFLNCSINRPVNIKMQNPDKEITDTLNGIDKEISTININLVDRVFETPLSGIYSLIVEEVSISKIVYQKNLSFEGPKVTIQDCTGEEWETYYYNLLETRDILNGFFITFKNTGDLPAYPYRVECILDNNVETTANFLIDEDIALIPGKSIKNKYCSCYYSSIEGHSTSYVLELTLQSYYGDDISESFEKVSHL